MKKCRVHRPRKVIISFFVLVLSLFFIFTSCSQLLAGNDLKNELEESIAQAKAASITVKIYPEIPESGSVIGNAEKSVKVNNTINLSFNCGSNYYFIGWAAYVNGVEDNKEEYVHIEPSKENATEATAKIKKYSATIDIKVLCSESLAVKEVYPTWGLVSPYDTNITATFNSNISTDNFRYTDEDFMELGFYEGEGESKKLASYVTLYKDANDLCYAYSLYDEESKTPDVKIKNIAITFDGENYGQYFGAPYVNERTVTIPVNLQNKIPMNQLETKNINVELSKSICSTNGISMINNKTFIYKINSSSDVEKDELAPSSINVVSGINKDLVDKGEVYIPSGKTDFLEFDADKLLNNSIVNELYFTMSATDNQSGIKKFCITETYVYALDGTKFDDSNESEPYLVPSTDYKYTEDGFTASVEGTYKLKGTVKGVYLIKFWAEDFNNHKSEVQTVTLLVRDQLSAEGWKLYNTNTQTIFISPNIYYDGDYTTFTLEPAEFVLFKDIKGTLKFEIYCGYTPDAINQLIPASDITKSGNNYKFTFDSSVLEGAFADKVTYLKVMLKANTGEETFFVMTVPFKTECINKSVRLAESQSANNSNAYKVYEFNFVYKNAYGCELKFVNSSAEGLTCINSSSEGSFRKRFGGDYNGSVYPKAFNTTVATYFLSDYGSIKAPRNTVNYSLDDINNKISTGSLPLADEYGNPITVELSEVSELGDFKIIKIKTSGQVPSVAKGAGKYAGFWFSTCGGSFYFEGTETTISVPKASVDIENYDFKAVEYNNSSSTASNHPPAKETPFWYLPDIEEYSCEKWITYEKSFFGEKCDYKGDYIRFSVPKTNISIKDTGTLYYKKIEDDSAFMQLMDSNRTNFYHGTWSGTYRMNFNKLEPYYLVKEGYLSLEEVRTFDSMTIKTPFDFGKDHHFKADEWRVPVKDLEDGNYMMFIEIPYTDESRVYPVMGSFCYRKKRATHKITSNSFTLTDTSVSVTCDEFPEDVNYAKYHIDYLNTGNQWTELCKGELYKKFGGENSSYFKLQNVDSAKSFSKPVDSSGWIKIYYTEADYGERNVWFDYHNNCYGPYDGVEKHYHHVPVYKSPKQGEVCNIKNILEGSAITVLCDKSTLIQTFCSPVNYGEDEENIDDWEYYTLPENILNPAVITENSNYTVPKSSIKKGYYYCVIAHFSDGTALISSVKQK